MTVDEEQSHVFTECAAHAAIYDWVYNGLNDVDADQVSRYVDDAKHLQPDRQPAGQEHGCNDE